MSGNENALIKPFSELTDFQRQQTDPIHDNHFDTLSCLLPTLEPPCSTKIFDTTYMLRFATNSYAWLDATNKADILVVDNDHLRVETTFYVLNSDHSVRKATD